MKCAIFTSCTGHTAESPMKMKECFTPGPPIYYWDMDFAAVPRDASILEYSVKLISYYQVGSFQIVYSYMIKSEVDVISYN
ncbi:hypothetical protein Avbf_06966 [Armadillidium vulgare]|nr:hypothetical protein Avbf_06966 [Armadillidium vulgare]